jgi:hypothetical protein
VITTHLSSCSSTPSVSNDTDFYQEQVRKWREYYITVFSTLGFGKAEEFIDFMLFEELFGSLTFCWQWLIGLYDDVTEARRAPKRSRRYLLEALAKERAERITRQYRKTSQYVRSSLRQDALSENKKRSLDKRRKKL